MAGTLRLRRPTPADGAPMWALARDAGLDLNSPYSYLLLGRYFPDTCLVAEEGEALVGFVTGFRPPREPDVLFVWQIGVAPNHRGRGLGRALLLGVLRQEGAEGVRYLAATVTPSNAPSRRLFRGLARDLGAPWEESEAFPARLFPAGSGHEAEVLIRIGPFERAALRGEEPVCEDL